MNPNDITMKWHWKWHWLHLHSTQFWANCETHLQKPCWGPWLLIANAAMAVKAGPSRCRRAAHAHKVFATSMAWWLATTHWSLLKPKLNVQGSGILWSKIIHWNHNGTTNGSFTRKHTNICGKRGQCNPKKIFSPFGLSNQAHQLLLSNLKKIHDFPMGIPYGIPSAMCFGASSFAHDQAEIAKSGASNSWHLAMAKSESVSRSGQSCLSCHSFSNNSFNLN